MIVIPHRELTQQALYGAVEEFINRDGTDYGEYELSLEQKVFRLMEQIDRKQAFIVFDDETETTSILSRQQLYDMGINPSQEIEPEYEYPN
jgi:uncharacterized protein YheU (UPF0270 family)